MKLIPRASTPGKGHCHVCGLVWCIRYVIKILNYIAAAVHRAPSCQWEGGTLPAIHQKAVLRKTQARDGWCEWRPLVLFSAQVCAATLAGAFFGFVIDTTIPDSRCCPPCRTDAPIPGHHLSGGMLSPVSEVHTRSRMYFLILYIPALSIYVWLVIIVLNLNRFSCRK